MCRPERDEVAPSPAHGTENNDEAKRHYANGTAITKTTAKTTVNAMGDGQAEYHK